MSQQLQKGARDEEETKIRSQDSARTGRDEVTLATPNRATYGYDGAVGWDPYRQNQIDSIEKVQRKAAKYIKMGKGHGEEIVYQSMHQNVSLAKDSPFKQYFRDVTQEHIRNDVFQIPDYVRIPFQEDELLDEIEYVHELRANNNYLETAEDIPGDEQSELKYRKKSFLKGHHRQRTHQIKFPPLLTQIDDITSMQNECKGGATEHAKFFENDRLKLSTKQLNISQDAPSVKLITEKLIDLHTQCEDKTYLDSLPGLMEGEFPYFKEPLEDNDALSNDKTTLTKRMPIRVMDITYDTHHINPKPGVFVMCITPTVSGTKRTTGSGGESSVTRDSKRSRSNEKGAPLTSQAREMLCNVRGYFEKEEKMAGLLFLYNSWQIFSLLPPDESVSSGTGDSSSNEVSVAVDPMGLYLPSCMIQMMYKLLDDCTVKVPLLTELDWYFMPIGNPTGFYYNTISVPKMSREKRHDGAPPHFDRRIRNHLNATFPDRWIGRDGAVPWTPRSPDLTPLDFFLWGDVKCFMYETPIDTAGDLVTRVVEAAHPKAYRKNRRPNPATSPINKQNVICYGVNIDRNFDFNWGVSVISKQRKAKGSKEGKATKQTITRKQKLASKSKSKQTKASKQNKSKEKQKQASESKQANAKANKHAKATSKQKQVKETRKQVNK
ncbi:hypothetical protein ANN_04264 [Periplaneta americana]|uniref:Uncharacterized protein n=1 Tax=Periplaneta americana TaxID=6978 RepID=A0ABQ8T839_PERAM|nr:hypothetical protein ANN_04264 [Periplaneta americana]